MRDTAYSYFGLEEALILTWAGYGVFCTAFRKQINLFSCSCKRRAQKINNSQSRTFAHVVNLVGFAPNDGKQRTPAKRITLTAYFTAAVGVVMAFITLGVEQY